MYADKIGNNIKRSIFEVLQACYSYCYIQASDAIG